MGPRLTAPAPASGRRPRQALAVLVVLGLLAGACDTGTAETTTTTTAPVETTTTTRPPDEPLRHPHGGEVVYALGEEPASLNPFLPAGANSRALALIGSAYLTGVRTIDPITLESVPRVVTELPSMANGGVLLNDDGTMTVRYTIRGDARWADGVHITGDDFLFTYETIMDPDLPIVRSVYEDMIPDAFEVGPKTFAFTLPSPSLAALDSVFDVLIPKHDVEGADFLTDFDRRTWVSGGPFVLDEWRSGSHLRFSRNDAYWGRDPETGQELPYLDALVFTFFTEATALIEAFTVGEADAVSLPASVAMLRQIQALEEDGARLEIVGGPTWEHLNFSFSENSLARNPNSYNQHYNYRRAIAHAIDRQRITEEILGAFLDPMGSYVDAFLPALSQRAWDRYAYDPDLAREYLERLCGAVTVDCRRRPPTAVFTTTIGDEARERIADLLAEMLEDVGIVFRRELEPSFLFLGNTVDSGTWDLGQWSWVGWPSLDDLVEFHQVFNPHSPLPEGFNFYRYGTPEVEGRTPAEVFDQGPGLVQSGTTERVGEIILALENTVDTHQLALHIRELERLIAEDIVIIPLYQSLDAAAVWADRVGNFQHARPVSPGSRDLATWYRVDAGA